MKNYSITENGEVTNQYGLVLKQRLNKKTGYMQVNLYDNGKGITYRTHRLVAITHIPNPDNLPEVNHINGNKTDNRVENLEWCTRKQNNDHAIKTGLNKNFGETSACRKLTEKQVLEIRAKYVPYKYHTGMLAKEYGVGDEQIRRIIHHQRWKHLS